MKYSVVGFLFGVAAVSASASTANGFQEGGRAPESQSRRREDESACTCNSNGDSYRLAAAIPPLNVSESEPTYPNICLEAAYIGLSLIPGTGGEPHKVSMVGATMYEAYSVSGLGNAVPLTPAGATKKNEMMGSGTMSDEEVTDYIGYTAYGTLRRVLSNAPDKVAMLDTKMEALGFDSSSVMDHSTAAFVMEVLMKYSLGPPADYVPTNPASTVMMNAECDALVDPAKWQALCVDMDTETGSCSPQQIPFSPFYNAKFISDNGERTVKALVSGVPSPPLDADDSLFLDQHRMTLDASATLDDKKKFMAEFFQPNAALRVGMLTINEAEARSLTLGESIDVYFAVTAAMRDSVAGSVTLKLDYDTIRPITVLQCHAEFQTNSTTMAWNRPYFGVREITNTGDDLWRPYLMTPPFPGYTSGHAGAAGAGTKVLSKFFPDGMVASNNCAIQPMGMSRTEPRIDAGEPGYIENVTNVPNQGPDTIGFAPAQDVTLCWSTYDDFAESLSESRLLGGIHIPMDNDEGLEWGRHIGEIMYAFFEENQKAEDSETPTKAPTTSFTASPSANPTDASSMGTKDVMTERLVLAFSIAGAMFMLGSV